MIFLSEQALLLQTQGGVLDRVHAKGRLVPLQAVVITNTVGRRDATTRPPLSVQPSESQRQESQETDHLKPEYGHRCRPQQGRLSLKAQFLFISFFLSGERHHHRVFVSLTRPSTEK